MRNQPFRSKTAEPARSVSYSNPPLQRMPCVTRSFAPLIRRVSAGDGGSVGRERCLAAEFRFIVHYAAVQDLRKAKEAAECYRTDLKPTSIGSSPIDRHDRSAKNTNFAKAFGAACGSSRR
jgi:hypothetical protein